MTYSTRHSDTFETPIFIELFDNSEHGIHANELAGTPLGECYTAYRQSLDRHHFLTFSMIITNALEALKALGDEDAVGEQELEVDALGVGSRVDAAVDELDAVLKALAKITGPAAP